MGGNRKIQLASPFVDARDINFYTKLMEVEDILIPHRHFKKAVERITRAIEFLEQGAEPRHTLLLGESGTGKTWLAQYLVSLYPRSYEENEVNIPILLVDTPPVPTLKGLAEAILIRLGDPYCYRGNAVDKQERALWLLKKCRVKLIIFEELQHFLDHGKYQSLTSVTDWLKRFIDDAKIPCLLMGLPRCDAILHENEQLRRRFSSRLELPPFSIDTPAEEIEFRAVLNEIDHALPTEHLSGLAEPDLARRLYFASNGVLGYLRKLLTGSFELMIWERKSKLDAKLLEQSFIDVIWHEGLKALNPFNTGFKFRRLDRIGEPFVVTLPKRTSRTEKAQ